MDKRERDVYVSRVAEKAGRHDGVAKTMKLVAKMGMELNATESELLISGYWKLIDRRRDSLEALASIEQEEKSLGNEENVQRVIAYKQKVETEITGICTKVLAIIDEIQIPSMYYHKMKGDFNSYLAEIKTGDDRVRPANEASKAYEAAMSIARKELPRAHPFRLGLDLNIAVFHNVILDSPQRARKIAKQAVAEATNELLDILTDEDYEMNVADGMKHVTEMGFELKAPERELLISGYWKLIRGRDSLEALASTEQQEKSLGNEENVLRVIAYKQKVETEITGICTEVLSLIDEIQIPCMYYHKMKGDFNRYLAEIKTGDDRVRPANEASKAYEAAMSIARKELPRAHPFRLCLDLSIAVYHNVILDSPQRARKIAKQAVEEATNELLDILTDEDYEMNVADGMKHVTEMGFELKAPERELLISGYLKLIRLLHFCRKGDSNRYLRPANEAIKAYEAAMSTARTVSPRAHPYRLGLDLNLAVYHNVIMESPQRACKIAKQAVAEATNEQLDILTYKDYEMSMKLLVLLNKNIKQWSSDED